MEREVLNNLKVLQKQFASYDRQWVDYKNNREFAWDVSHNSPIRRIYEEGRSLSVYLSSSLEVKYVNDSMLLTEYVKSVRAAIPPSVDYISVGQLAQEDYKENYSNNYTIKYMLDLYWEQWARIPTIQQLLTTLEHVSSYRSLVLIKPLDTIQYWFSQWEQNVQLHQHADENGLRAQLVLGLQQAGFGGVSEGHSYQGRTDILIPRLPQAGGAAAGSQFVAECKVWNGSVALSDAVSQLCRYVTPHDDQAALLVFVRSGNFSDVCAKAMNAIGAHPAYGSSLGGGGARIDFSLRPAQKPSVTIPAAVLFCNLIAGKY